MTLGERFARAVDAPAPGDLLTGDDDEAPGGDGTPAAVLVALVSRPEPTLLLTRRTDTLRHHAGQIAFPGGRADAHENAVAAALREAHEEVGLDPALVHVIGSADPYRTVTGFAVTPVLAVIPPDLPLVAQAAEVARAVAHPGLRHLVLSHLSRHNNTPALALASMRRALEGTAFRGTLHAAPPDAILGPLTVV